MIENSVVLNIFRQISEVAISLPIEERHRAFTDQNGQAIDYVPRSFPLHKRTKPYSNGILLLNLKGYKAVIVC